MPLKVSEIVDTVTMGKDPKEFYTDVFENIGSHIKKNASRFAEQIVDVHCGMKIEIDIPINDIVNFSIAFNEYIIKTEGK